MKFSNIIKELTNKNKRTGKYFLTEYAIKSVAILLSFFLLILVGSTDYIVGYKITLMPFYLIPVVLSAWYGGLWVGVFFAIGAGVIWLRADLLAGETYSNVVIPIWDMLGRVMIFLSPVFLVELRKSCEREKELRRHDYLTGVLNRLGFIERLAIEVERSRRHHFPSTFIMLDCDNFKHINDQYGHQEGDAVIRLVATALKEGIRVTDVVARMGGDEFIIFLSEADFDLSEKLIKRLKKSVSEAMKENNWPITVSIGAVTYKKLPFKIDDLLKKSDALMYFAKQKGKNAVEHEIIQ